MTVDGAARRSERAAVTRAWDAEYVAGRYQDEPPVAFVDDIVAAARSFGVESGLYIGCGNGRNYIPLVNAGLDLVGIDISAAAIAQLRERAPNRTNRLLCADLEGLTAGAYDLVIGIQVFQHGDRAQAHAHIRSAQRRIARGGLMAVRVNAVGTDLVYRHERTGAAADGSFTARYLEGPKSGLRIYFFAREGLSGLFAEEFTSVLELRTQATAHEGTGQGFWLQWEGIWRRN
jgi:SAM-dependent methyltransferase